MLRQDNQTNSNNITFGNTNNIPFGNNPTDEGPWIEVGKGMKNRPTDLIDTTKSSSNDYQHDNAPSSKVKYNANSYSNNLSNPSTETTNKSHIALVGDSMTKPINGRKLSRTCKVTSHSFPGATVEDLEYYVKPILKRKHDKIIIHAGAYNLRKIIQSKSRTK